MGPYWSYLVVFYRSISFGVFLVFSYFSDANNNFCRLRDKIAGEGERENSFMPIKIKYSFAEITFLWKELNCFCLDGIVLNYASLKHIFETYDLSISLINFYETSMLELA